LEKILTIFLKVKISHIKCIVIGLELEKINVHAIHITKNAYIKLHVEKGDMDYFIIGWLTKGASSGGYFQVHQLWYQFATSHGSMIFLWSKSLVHGIGE